jgi:transcriptional regulator with XRE-family HTH domain
MPKDTKVKKQRKNKDQLFEEAKEMLAANIRRLRAPKKWSQEKLADECGLHRTYIGAIERCEQNASLESIAKIAEVLEVSVWELIAPTEATDTNR